MKKCTVCHLEKELTHFYFQNKTKANGEEYIYYNPKCKECSKEAAVKWYKENPEKFKSYKDAQNHKPENKLIVKMRNREFIKNGYYREWYRKNKTKAKNYKIFRDMHKTHNITNEEWEDCKEFFNYSCAYCGLHMNEHYINFRNKIIRSDLHKEHVNHEGSNGIDNCVPSCKVCNSSKHTNSLDEWYNVDNQNYDPKKYNKILEWIQSFDKK